MHKNKLIKNTLLLVLGGFIVKILGFIIKVLYTRNLTESGVSLITLIFPTYSLLITITTFSIPLAVTKLTAQNKERKSSIIFNSLWISLSINLIILTIFLLFSDYFATTLLHEPKCSLLIKILIFSLPFISTTSIIKAYFFGKENVVPVIISNVTEELIKFLLTFLLLPKFVNKGTYYGVVFYILIILICEIFSFIILYIFLPKKINYKNLKYKYDYKISTNILKISVPTLLGRLIGNIGYFLEPIILTNLLIYKGLKSNYIILNYGYFQGYVIALLTIPSFFLVAFSNNIIPTISKYKSSKNYKAIKNVIKKVILMTLIGGIIFIFILSIFGKYIMFLLYKSTKGYIYLKTLLPFFILFYLEYPFVSILQSLDQEKNTFKITLLGIIIKYFSLTLLILLNLGFMSLIYSEIINILCVIGLSIYYLNNYFSYPSQ